MDGALCVKLKDDRLTIGKRKCIYMVIELLTRVIF